jgi:hypothetical protein
MVFRLARREEVSKLSKTEDFVMNREPSGSLNLSKAIPGFLNYKTAEGLSQRTIDSHERLLNKWLEHIGDQEINNITSQDVVKYINWLRNDYVPRRYSGKTHPLSPKTLRNVWVTLSSFYTWASHELNLPNIMKDVPSPRTKKFRSPPFRRMKCSGCSKPAPIHARRIQVIALVL